MTACDCLRLCLGGCCTGLDPAGLYGPMNGSEGIGRGGGEDGVQANSSLGALPSSTAFLGGGGNGNGGPFQLPNGLTRQDSFGMSLAGGAMHGAMHPMFRQDPFPRLNAANLAFSGRAHGNAVGNAVGHGVLGDQSSMRGAMGGAMPPISSMGKQNTLDASVSSVFSSNSGGEFGLRKSTRDASVRSVFSSNSGGEFGLSPSAELGKRRYASGRLGPAYNDVQVVRYSDEFEVFDAEFGDMSSSTVPLHDLFRVISQFQIDANAHGQSRLNCTVESVMACLRNLIHLESDARWTSTAQSVERLMKTYARAKQRRAQKADRDRERAEAHELTLEVLRVAVAAKQPLYPQLLQCRNPSKRAIAKECSCLRGPFPVYVGHIDHAAATNEKPPIQQIVQFLREQTWFVSGADVMVVNDLKHKSYHGVSDFNFGMNDDVAKMKAEEMYSSTILDFPSVLVSQNQLCVLTVFPGIFHLAMSEGAGCARFFQKVLMQDAKKRFVILLYGRPSPRKRRWVFMCVLDSEWRHMVSVCSEKTRVFQHQMCSSPQDARTTQQYCAKFSSVLGSKHIVSEWQQWLRYAKKLSEKEDDTRVYSFEIEFIQSMLTYMCRPANDARGGGP